MTMLNRLANQRFPTTAMTTGAPGVNAMPLAAPPPELRAKREAEYQPELMSHMELLRRNPGMMKVGEMPGSMGDLASVTKMLMRLDRVSPKALRFVRELFGQPGPGVRPGRDMADIISKAAPSAELRGGTLGVDEADVDPLVELLEGMGAPEGIAKGLKTVRPLERGPDVAGRGGFHIAGNVRHQVQDAHLAKNYAESDLVPLDAGGVGGAAIGMKPRDSRIASPSARPGPGSDVNWANPDHVQARFPDVPDEFVDFLRARTPETGVGVGPISDNLGALFDMARTGEIRNANSVLTSGPGQYLIDNVLAVQPDQLARLPFDDLHDLRRQLIQMQQGGVGVAGTGKARSITEQAMNLVQPNTVRLADDVGNIAHWGVNP